ncbi:phosphoglycerate dehydrogenase [Hyphomonas sp. UBA4494]|jgi:D-3-phosphoglycerate dehydrogenase|uniref:phosphoglycerate dehydrogenase n=1 Tax=Hyphomonas sp. UBA4494 TaxID=1946631 RepID=UPI0025C15E84|nr:phosphoglycerate dehydrogenase [Hyphomonas sp. UBA4494]
MNNTASVAVLSRSFSAHEKLAAELNRRYSDVTLNDTGRTLAGDELVAFLQGKSHVVVALEKITDDILARLPDLKVIGKYGVGLNNVDLHACEARGVHVGWTGGVNRRSVAELVIALSIASLRHVVRSHMEIVGGEFRQIKGRQLQGRKVGLLGCGHVGKEVARLMLALGCEVQAHDIRDLSEFCEETGVKSVSLDELVETSEVLSLHVPFTPATSMIINADRLARMRTDAVLINTARGGLVDEAALKRALHNENIAAAAFDVFDPEPPTNMDLLRLPNFIATGHIGGSAEEAIFMMGMAAIEGLENAQPALSHIPDYLR